MRLIFPNNEQYNGDDGEDDGKEPFLYFFSDFSDFIEGYSLEY
jgi:hypothetical protein